ncbi:MAG: hypothetical protein OXR66_09440 [Candidatus Woesearchaeota archaeon]|nr:hypothetical protein [Candidatus Woesearchaeota archaeon]
MRKYLPLLGLITLNLLVVAFLWEHSILSTLLVLFIGIAALLYTKKETDVILYVLMVVVSFIFEALFVHLGTWTHNNADLLGVPLRLPLSWGMLAIAMKYLSVFLDEKFEGSNI